MQQKSIVRFLIFLLLLLLNPSKAFSQKENVDRISSMNMILLDSLFIAEYASVLDLIDKGKMAKVKSKQDFFNTKEGIALFKRGVFGYASARGRGFRLKNFNKVQALINENNLLKGREKIIFEKKPEARTLETTLWPLVNESFINPKFKDFWSDLGASFTSHWPPCSGDMDFSEVVKVFLKLKKEADQIKENERGAYWAKNLVRFKNEGLQCLALAGFVIDNHEETKDYSAEMFFDAYEKAGFINEKDPVLRLAASVVLFWQARFSESLRIILELQDKNPSYRLPYEIIQRIYSFQHAGKGEVALQGL